MIDRIDANVTGYEVIAHIQANIGEQPTRIGVLGACRYCGENDRKHFRKKAHTFPEAFGNKWVLSVDECDKCNAQFGAFEDALAKSVGAILTVGGTLGKGNSVRQTGRTRGSSMIRHDRNETGRQILMNVTGGSVGDHVKLDPSGRTIQFTVPTGSERFVPRHAYKALAKMGLALLPTDEITRFSKLLAWVRSPRDTESFSELVVGLSFGSVGNAPQIVTAALLRRQAGIGPGPYMVFVLSIGSVCFQIDLKSDSMDGSWPPPSAACSIRWAAIIGPDSRARQVRIDFDAPIHLDWSPSDLTLSPIESLVTTVDLATNDIRMHPIMRWTH